MGRPEKPLNPADGPLAQFGIELRELKASSGLSYRQIAELAHYSASALSEATSGKNFPTWGLTAAFVQACGDDPQSWRVRWERFSNEVGALAPRRPLGSRYRIGEFLGAGASGRVWLGVDERGRKYAFKVLRSDLGEDSDFVARFVKERSIMLGLRHENLVEVHDMVVEGDTYAIVMDFVEGGDLRALLNAQGTLQPSEVARIGAGIARALGVVHGALVVHRDVKPENILIDLSTSPPTPRLTDFGVSRLVSGEKLGKSTLLAGTPNYVAPEIANGEAISEAADLYSLGIVLYELCCGVTPFASDSVFQVLRSHGEVAPGRPDGVPDQLWAVISMLLEKSAASRPSDAVQVADALESISRDEEVSNFPAAKKVDNAPRGLPVVNGNNNETILRGSWGRNRRYAPNGQRLGDKSESTVSVKLAGGFAWSDIAMVLLALGFAAYLIERQKLEVVFAVLLSLFVVAGIVILIVGIREFVKRL